MQTRNGLRYFPAADYEFPDQDDADQLIFWLEEGPEEAVVVQGCLEGGWEEVPGKEPVWH